MDLPPGVNVHPIEPGSYTIDLAGYADGEVAAYSILISLLPLSEFLSHLFYLLGANVL
jgi:hypothetical protein